MAEVKIESPADLPTTLTFYETAKLALAEARRVDETMKIRDRAARIRFAGQQAKDREIMADAMEIQIRAEHRLGELIIEAKRAGQIVEGRRRKVVPVAGEPERVTLDEAGVDRKLSSRAQQLAERPADELDGVVKAAREKILSGGAVVVNPIKDLNTQDKALRRAIKEHELAQRQKDLPAEIFGLIMEDPEWQFDTWSELGKDRAADNHYPTSTLEALKARPVAKLAAPDCVYFLWATVPMLPQALELMAARGFAYKTHFIWDKVEAGTGYWNRNRHELLLVGVRGSVPAPAMGTQWESVIAAPKGVHSAKPDWAYELAEHYYPSLKKIELNARRLRSGWTAWGYEAPEDDESSSESSSTDAGEVSAHETTPRADEASETASSAAIQQGAPAGSAGVTRAGVPGRPDLVDAVAATPETGAGALLAGSLGAGEGDEKLALSQPLPHEQIEVGKLTSDEKNDIIRAAYALDPFPGGAFIAQRTGLSTDAVKQRARTMKLGSRDRQKAAVVEANKRRVAA